MDKEKDPEEDFKAIDGKYGRDIEEIRQGLQHWKNFGEDRGAIEKHFEELHGKFKELREYIANYSYIIPSYNLQTYQQQLDTINESIVKEKEVALPKKKFTFARKQPAPKQKTQEEKKEPVKQQPIQTIVTNDLAIKDVSGQTIKKTEAEYEGKESVIIENLT